MPVDGLDSTFVGQFSLALKSQCPHSVYCPGPAGSLLFVVSSGEDGSSWAPVLDGWNEVGHLEIAHSGQFDSNLSNS